MRELAAKGTNFGRGGPLRLHPAPALRARLEMAACGDQFLGSEGTAAKPSHRLIVEMAGQAIAHGLFRRAHDSKLAHPSGQTLSRGTAKVDHLLPRDAKDTRDDGIFDRQVIPERGEVADRYRQRSGNLLDSGSP